MFATITLKLMLPSSLMKNRATPRAFVSRGVGASFFPASTATHWAPASSARATAAVSVSPINTPTPKNAATTRVARMSSSGCGYAARPITVSPTPVTSFSENGTELASELPHALLRRRRRSPRLLEDLEVGLDEVRAVRPQRRLGLSSDRPLVLDQECHHHFPIDEDEAAALAVDVPQGNVLRDAGHKPLVPLVDVRNEPRLHLAPHRLEEDLVEVFAVRALQALRRREAQDLRFRRADELSQGAVDLGPALDDLQSDRRRLAGPPGDAGPTLEQRLPDRVELLELRALLLGNHLEDVVDGPRRVPPGAVDRDLYQAPRLEALQGAIRLHAVHAAHPRQLASRGRARAGEVHEHERLVAAQAHPLQRVAGLGQLHREEGCGPHRIN